MADHIRERMRCLEILDLSPTATEDEIKKKYKTMALKYHPDKNKSEGATERFQEIQYAYKYLQEGPEILDHHSEDDDDGIPIFFLMRLFPWLFQSYASGAGKHPTYPRFFMYDDYDTSSDEEYDTPDDEYGASTYKATSDASSAQKSTSAKGRKSESKRQKKKRAKQKRREEKSAAAKTQKEKVQTSSDSSCRENPIISAAQTDQAKDDNSEKPDSGRGGCLPSNKDNPASADSASSQVPQAEEGKSGQPSIVSDDSQTDTNAEVSKSSTKNTGAGQPQPLQPPHLPPKKSKQQIREEQRKREEEVNKIRKELEENLRLEQERKARKQAAREEKERLEAERRKQQEEEEIAAEAQRLMLEEKKHAEEKARKQKEEEEERERLRLLADLDSNMFMDASGDFLTRDSEGVGNIKKRAVVYTSPEYDSLWEQRSERPSSHNQPYGQSSFNQPFRAFRGGEGYRGGRDFRFPRGGPSRGFQPRPTFQTGNYPTRMEPSSQSWEEQMQMSERWEEQHQAGKSSQPDDDKRSHSNNQELFTTASARGPPESPRQTFHKRTDIPMQGYGRVNQVTDSVPFRLNDPNVPQPTFGGGLSGPPGKHGGVPGAQSSNNAGSMQQTGAVNQSNGPHSASKVVHNGFASDSLRGRGRENVGLNVTQKNNLHHGGDDRMQMERKHNNPPRPTTGDVKASLPEKKDHGELASIFNGSRLEKVVERSSSISSDGSDFHQLPPKPHFSAGMRPPLNRSAMHSAASGAPPLLPFPTPGLPPGFNQQNLPGFSPFVHQPFFTQRPATPQPFVSQPAVAQRPPSSSQTILAAPSFVHVSQIGGPPFQPVPPGPQFASPSQQTSSQWAMHRPAPGQVPQRGSVPPFDSKPQPATSLHQAYKGSGSNVSDVFSSSHGLDDIDD